MEVLLRLDCERWEYVVKRGMYKWIVETSIFLAGFGFLTGIFGGGSFCCDLLGGLGGSIEGLLAVNFN